MIEKQFTASSAKGDPKSLRKLINYFDGLPITENAQLQLVKKLDLGKDGLEMEFLLDGLRQSKNKEVAGYATARLLELHILQSRESQLTQFIKQLETDYANVVCFNNKTGTELATSWKKNKKLFSLLAEGEIFPD